MTPEQASARPEYRDGYLVESDGLGGASSLRRIELSSGRVVNQSSCRRATWPRVLCDRVFQATLHGVRGSGAGPCARRSGRRAVRGSE